MKAMDLTEYYEAQTSLLRLERQIKKSKEAVKQAKYDLRTAEEMLLNYRSGVRALLDRLSGRRMEKEETLASQIRHAGSTLELLLQEQERLMQQKREWEEKQNAFPTLNQLRQSTDEKQWAVLESKYCAEVLDPLLMENHRALLEYRSLMQGQYPVLSSQRQQEIYAEPDSRAKQCAPYLYRLKEALDILEIPFSIGSYYESPITYLVNVVSDHNRRDRVNQALEQVEKIQRLLKELQ